MVPSMTAGGTQNYIRKSNIENCHGLLRGQDAAGRVTRAVETDVLRSQTQT